MEFLHFLTLCAPPTSLFKARHKLFGKQIFRKVSQILLQQTGYSVRLILFQIWRLLSVIGCFQLIHLWFNSLKHSNSEKKRISRRRKIKQLYLPLCPPLGGTYEKSQSDHDKSLIMKYLSVQSSHNSSVNKIIRKTIIGGGEFYQS